MCRTFACEEHTAGVLLSVTEGRLPGILFSSGAIPVSRSLLSGGEEASDRECQRASGSEVRCYGAGIHACFSPFVISPSCCAAGWM